jgi:putative ABC transport system permease protein
MRSNLAWSGVGLTRCWRDAVYGARALRREPAFALTALLTLSLGIATTTTTFSVVDAELWKPLPFPQPDRLVAVEARSSGTRNNYEQVSAPDYLDWRTQSRLVEYAAELTIARRVIRRTTAEPMTVMPVTANFFRVLGRVPVLGRGFEPEDEHAHVAILSDGGWRRLFDADPGILGRTISLDGVDFSVVGITAGEYLEFQQEPEAFVVADLSAAELQRRATRNLNVVGRLRPDASISQAQAELQTITARIAQAFPADHSGYTVRLADLRQSWTGYNWRPLQFFLAAASLVLLLACMNVANLLLGRALRRQREFAIRGALGGGPRALVRQLIVEGALLAVPSAMAGALLSSWTLALFRSQIPSGYLNRGGHFMVDARIAAFVILITALTSMVLSVAPFFFARRIDLNLMLGQGGRTVGRSRRHVRLRNGLLVGQLTMTLVLLVGAGLFMGSYARLTTMPLGFEPEDRVALRAILSGKQYTDDAAIRGFADRLIERTRAVPGVRDVGIGTSSPLGSGQLMRFAVGGRPLSRAGEEPTAIIRAVSPGYFRTLGIAQRFGRAFESGDVAGAPRVALINEHLANRVFAGDDPIGRRLELLPRAGTMWAPHAGSVTIVGVVGNVKDVGLNEVDFNDLYVPFAQVPAPTIELVVRTSIGPASIANSLRAAAATVDPAVPVTGVMTLPERVANARKGDRFNLLLIVSFGVVAITLAAVGIYGAMACAVQERTREFGVRLALGEQPASIVISTLRASARFGIIGAVLGTTLVLSLARVIGNALYLVAAEHEGLLYGVTTTEPAAIGSAGVALVLIAAVSGVIPARQASKVDPIVTLRHE